MAYYPGQGNGFFEKTVMLITVFVSFVLGDASLLGVSDGFITLWLAFLAIVILYLAWSFDQYRFGVDEIRSLMRMRQSVASESGDVSWGTMVHTVNKDLIPNAYERTVDRHVGAGVVWWFFRVVYVITALMLLAVVAERLFWGTDTLRQAIIVFCLKNVRFLAWLL